MDSNVMDNSIEITYVGHSTVMLQMEGVKILTDPVFRKRIWFLKRHASQLPVEADFSSLDAIVLSHMHFDHMDYPSLRRVPACTPIIAPKGAWRFLKRKIAHEVIELGEGNVLKIGEVAITATPSVHKTGFYWPFWYPSTVLSYMFQGKKTVYFVGDTALFDTMSDLGKDYDIDAALLPVWGYGPYIRGDHLSPADAAHAVSMLCPKTAIPIHWGTLRPIGPWWRKMTFLSDPPLIFRHLARRFAPHTDVRVLYPGERTAV